MADEAKTATVEQNKQTTDKETDSSPITDVNEDAKETIESTEETSESLAEGSKDTNEKEPPAEQTDDETEMTDDLSEYIRKDEAKGYAQKRIDKLIAETKSKNERIANLEGKLEALTSKDGDSKFTEAQLKTALKKAVEENDTELLWEVIKYDREQTKKSLRDEYREETSKARQVQERNAQEWNDVRSAYQYLSDPNEPEVYAGSRKDLNINNSNSLLVRLATQLYWAKDSGYQHPGGQQLATANALNSILQKRRGVKSKDNETSKLEQKLAKEKRKSSLGASGAQKEEAPLSKKTLTPSERLLEVIEERKNVKSQADEAGLKFYK